MGELRQVLELEPECGTPLISNWLPNRCQPIALRNQNRAEVPRDGGKGYG
jgi:hypothetical protein